MTTAAFTSEPARSKMLFNRADLTAYFASRPDLKSQVKITAQDRAGFSADVGTNKAVRFDFPFNGEAFFEILSISA